MQITGIQKTKRGRYSIYLEEEFVGVLHLDCYAAFPYQVGEDVDLAVLAQALQESQLLIAKERALRLLSARSYTAKGLTDKLLRDVDADAAAQIVERMQELGLINDADYAHRYAADCQNLRGYSKKQIAQALYQRGIDRETIEETLTSYDSAQSEQLIYQLLKKKYPFALSDPALKNKAVQALLRKGFVYNDIAQVFYHLEQDENFYLEQD